MGEDFYWRAVKWTPLDKHKGEIHIVEVKYGCFVVQNCFGECLNKSCEWEGEPLPSNKDDSFFMRCTFDNIIDAEVAYRKWKENECSNKHRTHFEDLRTCPKCGGKTVAYTYSHVIVWCTACGHILYEEGDKTIL